MFIPCSWERSACILGGSIPCYQVSLLQIYIVIHEMITIKQVLNNTLHHLSFNCTITQDPIESKCYSERGLQTPTIVCYIVRRDVTKQYPKGTELVDKTISKRSQIKESTLFQ
jgi:hypothetical protein